MQGGFFVVVFFFLTSPKSPRKNKMKREDASAAYLMPEEYSGCIALSLHIISDTIHTFSYCCSGTTNKFNAAVAGQCLTTHLEIKPSFSQLKSVFLYIHVHDKRLIP